MIYFDHCASTPPYEEVVDTMAEVMKRHYANPSSLHGQGQAAAKLIDRSRAVISEHMRTSKGSWLFTSGGTESNNLAIKGAARQYKSRGRHIVSTGIEHASVLEALKQLEQEGFTVTLVPAGPTGHVSADAIEAAMTKETILVSVMHVNNEVGTVQPLEEIGKRLKAYPKTLFHVDAVQAIGKVPIDIEGWGIDLLSGSAHKLRGPRGAGYLYVRNGVALQPLSSGGSQEAGFRAGTENVAAIVASAKALRMAAERMDSNSARLSKLGGRLRAFIASVPELKLNGESPLAPHIVHFSYPGMKPEVIVHMLEQHGIMASTKSACSSKENKPSKVLLAMGASEEVASSGIRISFGDEHEEADVAKLEEALRAAVKSLKPLERSNKH